MIAALVLAAVLFVLVWPEERGTGRGRARAVLFALLAGTVGYALTGRQAGRAATVPTGRAFQAYTDGLINARAAEADTWSGHWIGALGGIPPAPLPHSKTPERPNARAPERRLSDQIAQLHQRALRSYAQAIRFSPDSILFRRQYAILLADAGQREAALRQFREVARLQASRRQPSDERTLWERLFGPQPPRPRELPALAARLRSLHLGWFEYLVRRSVYRRMGLKQQAEEMSDRAGREAFLQVSILGVLTLAMFGVAALGIGLLIASFIRWRRGRLRPVPAALHAGAAPLLEPFVLYLFLTFLPALLRVPGRLPRGSIAELALWVAIVLLLLPDLLAMIPLFYLWTRLRALSLSLAEIGFHARDLGRNILTGFGGYAAALPVVYGSALLANWLGHRFFPQVPTPFHPIVEWTESARSGWIRVAILIVAAVGAPFFEEIFFRGVLYGALRRRFGVVAGIIASAAIFSSLHPQLPLGFLPIFVLGVIMAALYEWRQSLIPGMVLHALHNGILCVGLNLLFPPG